MGPRVQHPDILLSCSIIYRPLPVQARAVPCSSATRVGVDAHSPGPLVSDIYALSRHLCSLFGEMSLSVPLPIF